MPRTTSSTPEPPPPKAPGKAPAKAKAKARTNRRTNHLTRKEVAQALIDSHGLVSVAAKVLGAHRDSVYRALKRWPELHEVKAAATEDVNDVAEHRLFQAIERGDPWAVQFYLKTKGKARGYVERSELDLRGVDLTQVPTDQLQAWLQDT
jgi:hypothetical protein